MDVRQNYKFLVSTKVLFGAGKLGELHTLPLPGRKALLVISSGKSVKTNGYLDKTIDELKQAGVESIVFNEVQANPHKETVEAGAATAVASNCDFVVALGGGSVLDAAKLMAMLATNGGDLWDYAIGGTGRKQPVRQKPLPWIAIPTTAGTGSEVDIAGVITNLATKEKMGILGSCADYAIIDPELTLSIPPRFTVFQGFDALFHSLEGYICRTENIFSEMVQEKVISSVSHFLPIAYHNGKDLKARSALSFAAMLSGYSMMASTCTAEHSIEHALSAYHEQLPHGAGLIMISQAYFATIIRQHTCDERFLRMAKLMGMEEAAKPEDFLTALLKLQQQCDVSNLRMSDYGIQPSEFDTMATNAIEVMCRLTTQDIQPLTHDEIVEILKQSYQ